MRVIAVNTDWTLDIKILFHEQLRVYSGFHPSRENEVVGQKINTDEAARHLGESILTGYDLH